MGHLGVSARESSGLCQDGLEQPGTSLDFTEEASPIVIVFYKNYSEKPAFVQAHNQKGQVNQHGRGT
jgi:hypothetical protein